MEDATTKAVEQFLSGGAGAGYALALLFAIAIIWLANRLLKSQDALISSKDQHRADIEKYAILSEANKNAIVSNTDTIKAFMDAYKEARR